MFEEQFFISSISFNHSEIKLEINKKHVGAEKAVYQEKNLDQMFTFKISKKIILLITDNRTNVAQN